jgi:hypothetical protein
MRERATAALWIQCSLVGLWHFPKKKRSGAAAAQQIQHSLGGTKGDVDHAYLEWCGGVVLASRDENGMDIFRPYSRLNPFRGVWICLYLSPDIQHLIPYPYLNTQIVYL